MTFSRRTVSSVALAASVFATCCVALPAFADPFGVARSYTVPTRYMGITGGDLDCAVYCMPRCGSSDGQVWSSAGMFAEGVCSCTCMNTFPAPALDGRQADCATLSQDLCTRRGSCLWVGNESKCYARGRLWSSAPRPADAPVWWTPATFDPAWHRPILSWPSCEVLVDGTGLCTVPIRAHYPQQLETRAGATAVEFFVNGTQPLGTSSVVPSRIAPSTSFPAVAYASWSTPNEPPFEAQLLLSAADATRYRDMGQTTLTARLGNASPTALVDWCTAPDGFVQWIVGYRTSGLTSIFGSANDIAGVCDSCGLSNLTIDQLPMTNLLGAEIAQLRNKHTLARPLGSTLLPPYAAVPAFNDQNVKLAAAELWITKQQAGSAFAMNARAFESVSAALADIDSTTWTNPMLVAALEQAKYVYQTERTIYHMTRLAVDLVSLDNKNAFDRYTGDATPALADTDYRRAAFEAACPPPGYCNRSIVRAQASLFQGVADMKASVGAQKRQVPWLAPLMTDPVFAQDVLPADTMFWFLLRPLIRAELTTRRDQTRTRLIALHRLLRYLNCGEGPSLAGIVDGVTWEHPFEELRSQTAAIIEPQLDDLLRYVSVFHVAAPRPPEVNPSDPASVAARKEALWLDGAIQTVQTLRQAIVIAQQTAGWVRDSAIVLGIVIATQGVTVAGMPAFLARLGSVGRWVQRPAVARVLSGLGQVSEVGTLALAMNQCERYLNLTTDDEMAGAAAYWECARTAQLVVTGGYFLSATRKVVNTLGTSLGALQPGWGSFVRSNPRFVGRYPGSPLPNPDPRTEIQRRVDVILDGAPGVWANPLAFRPNDPQALAMVSSLETLITQDATFVGDFAAAKSQLVAAVRREVELGLSPDHAELLNELVTQRIPVKLVSQVAEAIATYEGIPLRTATFMVKTTPQTYAFWHESGHALDLVRFHFDTRMTYPVVQAVPGKRFPSEILAEMTAQLRASDRDIVLAYNRVRITYRDSFIGGSGVGFTDAIPELWQMTPVQALELFHKLSWDHFFRTMTAADLQRLRYVCNARLELLIESVVKRP